MRIRATPLVGLLLAMCAGLAWASYLTSDYGDTPQQAPPERIIRPVPPPPPPPRRVSNPLTDMLSRVVVRDGYRWRGLTVYPVELRTVTDRRDYLSVSEALADGLLAVREKGAGNVPVLVVENRGDRPVLMLGGELVLGGKQNRVLREDVLLPGRSGPVEVPVFCIEHGRWTDKPAAFECKQSVAPLAVREAARSGASQDAVWAGVSGYCKSLGVESRTSDLQAVHDSPEVRKELADCRESFIKHCWRQEQVGMVVARYNQIVGADLFANAALFRKHRDRLLESYAVDCIACKGVAADRVAAPGRDEAERFLLGVFDATFDWRGTPGLGRLLSVSGAGLSGSALVNEDDVLHACLAAQNVIIIEPVPLPRRMLPED